MLFFGKRPAAETPWTKTVWIYDFRTNQSFTLKERPLKRAHLDEFVSVAKLSRRHERQGERTLPGPSAMTNRTSATNLNLDIFWLKDASLEDPDSLPPPAEIAAEIAESLEAALDRFRAVAAQLA